jgi:tetratricopeptide (TPR) repeat protein
MSTSLNEPGRTRPIRPAEALRLARKYREQGRDREAYPLYCHALAADRDGLALLQECAEAALSVGRAEEAVLLFRRAISVRPGAARPRLGLARALHAGGDLEPALAACRKALDLEPALLAAEVEMAEILADQGRLEDACVPLRRVLEHARGHATAHRLLGTLLHRLGRLEEAAHHLQSAILAEPAGADTLYSLGTVLHAMHRFDEALAAYDRALSLKPSLSDALFEVGKPRHIHALLDRGDPRRALGTLNRYLARRPGQACALALKAVALEELGERPAAAALVDFDRLITRTQVASLPGCGDLATMNEALARHILAHPTLRQAPASFSLSRGRSTGELLAPPLGPVPAFERLVRVAIAEYCRTLPGSADHPFVAAMPQAWRLAMWANVIEAEGYQVPHIHPSGWLSAVYYVKVPAAVRTEAERRSGWLEFGEPYHDITHSFTPRLRSFQPEPGLLLLFPSYFYHKTLPFTAQEQRISISFDVVPEFPSGRVEASEQHQKHGSHHR